MERGEKEILEEEMEKEEQIIQLLSPGFSGFSLIAPHVPHLSYVENVVL